MAFATKSANVVNASFAIVEPETTSYITAVAGGEKLSVVLRKLVANLRFKRDDVSL